MPIPPPLSHATHERPVLLRYRPRAPARFVDLRGEMGSWRQARPLAPTGDGWFEGTVYLGPGVYAYKLRHDDGSWHLDEANPRTVARDGARNNVLVIGGTDEPVLHAPGAPWVSLEDDGRVRVRAGLRHGHGERLVLRWDEGSGERSLPMRRIADEDEHALFDALVPSSARTVRYVFELPNGRSIGLAGGACQAVELDRSALASSVPAWWRDALVYTIFVDRFARRGGLRPLEREDGRAGGDLDGIVDAIPWLCDLGVTALHLTPIALAPTSHRYAAEDPRVVDPALGGEDAFARLLEAAHAAGLKIIADVATTHVHESFAPFRDVVLRGPRSPYFSWFHVDSWPFGRGEQTGYRCYQGKQFDEPLLRFEEPAVIEWLAGTFEHWARLGVDGFRIDAAADLPLPVVRAIRDRVRAAAPGAILFGEVVPDNAWRMLDAGLHAATEFPLREALVDLLVERRIDAHAYASIAARRRFYRGGPGHRAIAFSATHDQPRLRTLAHGDPRIARLGHLLVLLGPEVPALFAGDEIGLYSDQPDRGFEGAWPDRMPMEWRPEHQDRDTLALVRSAIALRRRFPADDAEVIALAERVLCLRRHGEEPTELIVNASEAPISVPVPEGPAEATVLLTSGAASLERGEIALGPYAAIVVRRRPDREIRALLDRLADGAPTVAEQAFEAGLTEVPSSPPRLYVTVTERCNLGCVHCITRAPTLTRDGRARQITPAVIAALGPAFASARYVGFAHGGESLVSPVFFDVLDAIGKARAARPGRTDVHLLTNGTRLTPDTSAKLVDRGVTSLAISLDGASARTNDAIRVGSSFDQICSHTLAAARLRDERGYDLRIGLSLVLTTPLVAELDTLGVLATELGVDWVKIEEMVPTTHVASLLIDRMEGADDALAALRERCEGAGIVLCDHRASSSACTCEGNAEFRAADDFVNRALIRPCRAYWEQAVIDPDGTARAVDYDHSPLGNVCERPLLELWNAPDVQAARRLALRRRPRDARVRCVEQTRELRSDGRRPIAFA